MVAIFFWVSMCQEQGSRPVGCFVKTENIDSINLVSSLHIFMILQDINQTWTQNNWVICFLNLFLFSKLHHECNILSETCPIQCILQYIPRNMHAVFALLCFVVVTHWLIFPYPPGLLHWHCGNLTIAPVPAKQPWWIWINTSCEFIMNDCITTTKQSTTKPCAYFLGYTVGEHTGH